MISIVEVETFTFFNRFVSLTKVSLTDIFLIDGNSNNSIIFILDRFSKYNSSNSSHFLRGFKFLIEHSDISKNLRLVIFVNKFKSSILVAESHNADKLGHFNIGVKFSIFEQLSK